MTDYAFSMTAENGKVLMTITAGGELKFGEDVTPKEVASMLHDAWQSVRTERMGEIEKEIRRDERERILNHPEISDFLSGVVIEAQHASNRWEDAGKRDFDWNAVATYLSAKAMLNPAQNDGTTGKDARLHRIVALGALAYNWHAAVLARPEE